MEKALSEEGASDTGTPSGDLSDGHRRSLWWPMWMAPWAVTLALATTIPLSKVQRWKGAPTPAVLV